MKKAGVLLGLLLCAGVLSVQAQQVRPGLKPLSESLKAAAVQEEQEIQEYLAKTGLPRNRVTPDGRVISLYSIDEKGNPVFVATHNARAANTINVSSLYTGASMGLNLSGKDMELGIWEAGGVVRETHQEFAGRIENFDAPGYSDHASHVAGTMIATGVASEAKGMAYEARLRSYDSSADNSEMSEEAANGMLISNHSYGFVIGWDFSNGGWNWNGDEEISTREDYRFGLYGNAARAWDNISYNAPYYLIVKSAGNDRSDDGDGTRPGDGPYDILGPQSVAKNILTVAAVRGLNNKYSEASDVQMSSFSSWGPTDDGRIKPDIAACGVNMVSAVSGADDAYGSLSGTSMAAPSASGALALLQELYAQQNAGNFMKSATLKGLTIHTANEAGEADGPDYIFGWGLMDVEKAAQAILDRNTDRGAKIEELTLLDGEETSMSFEAAENSPVTVTICWTDLPGVALSPSLDPDTLNLVNDLDLRVRDEDGNIYEPWIVDPAEVEAPATKGDNFRDNVEKIEFIAPKSGTYTLTVNHKDTLVASSEGKQQDFSLILTVNNKVAPTYYWVGGAGNWSDTLNWSNASGGNSAGSIPTANSIVVFDENSMLTADSIVQVDTEAMMGRLVATSQVSGIVNIPSAQKMSVAGNIVILGDMGFSGSVELTGDQAQSVIEATNTIFDELIFRGSSANSNWMLVETLNANSIRLEEGFLSGESVVLQADRVSSLSANTGFDFEVLEILASHISIDPNTNINAGVYNIYLESEGEVVYEGTSLVDELLLNGASGKIAGGSAFEVATIEGGVIRIEDNNSFGVLNLSPNTTLELEQGSTQEIVEALNATGSEGNLITLMSSGNGAVFTTASPRVKHCADYLAITDVRAEGNAAFSAGVNSTLTGNTEGWSALACDDVQFVNFTSEFFCEGGLTFFTDLSSGNPVAWTWDFGDGSASTLQNPRFVYPDSGDYTVKLTVTYADNTELSVSEVINIEEQTSTPSPGISVNGDLLSSTVGAANYQWVLNGEPIDGATTSSFQAVDAGTYTLWVWNNRDQCRYESDPIEYGTTTSLEDTALAKAISIAPNPSTGVFQLKLNLGIHRVNHYEIKVLDMLGREVSIQAGNEPSNALTELIDLSGYRSGNYLIHIKMDQGVAVKRVVKR